MVSNRIAGPSHGSAPGGLTSGLVAAMRAHPGIWCGWDGQTVEHRVTDAAMTVGNDGITYASISYDAGEYRDFYLGFCNSTLWPLVHQFVDDVQHSDSHYEAYRLMNRRYARELTPLLRPDDLVWVHDYHFLLLARSLRETGCTQRIGLFLHTPFPPLAVLRTLPQYRELLAAMLEFDVVGFQTQTDHDEFRRTVAHMLGGRYDSAAVGPTTGVFPIGVDVDAIQRIAGSAMSNPREGSLILGVDRLDYTKGLIERVRAFDRFLAAYPDHQNQVSFLQIAAPTRTQLTAYTDTRCDLERAIADTNQRYAHPGWTPIRYLNGVLGHDTLLGVMRSAQVGMVTPLRDGMNLVAKEYAAAQDPADPGVLILSKFAGAAEELTSALLVNPHDSQATAEAIQRALTMSVGERRERHQAMLEVLRRNSIGAWHTRFVETLAGTERRIGHG